MTSPINPNSPSQHVNSPSLTPQQRLNEDFQKLMNIPGLKEGLKYSAAVSNDYAAYQQNPSQEAKDKFASAYKNLSTWLNNHQGLKDLVTGKPDNSGEYSTIYGNQGAGQNSLFTKMWNSFAKVHKESYSDHHKLEYLIRTVGSLFSSGNEEVYLPSGQSGTPGLLNILAPIMTSHMSEKDQVSTILNKTPSELFKYSEEHSSTSGKPFDLGGMTPSIYMDNLATVSVQYTEIINAPSFGEIIPDNL